nr:DUF2141 domain-containing protein [Sphingomonas populi]
MTSGFGTVRAWATLAVLAMLGTPALAGGATGTGILHVQIGNVRTAHGRVHIDVCTQAQFLKDCPISAEAPARVGITTVSLTGLPPGRYAVQAFLDENGNGKVDQALFGIPKEGVGFSNDARIRLGPPKWTDAMFDTTGGEQTIRFNLRYFLGGDAKR